jgi:formyltetrahydrofolate hydrolase
MSYPTRKTNILALRVSCAAASGLIAAVTNHLGAKGCYSNELAHYDD